MKTSSIAFILTCLLSIPLGAQSLIMDQYVPQDPQAWGFIKYGGQTPDLYTGTVRAEIPIYTYKDPDFEIPVALSYSSNGYMPNIQANFVGLGWTLIAGGVITRKVNGIKDEGSEYISNHNQKGFYFYSKINSETDILQRARSNDSPFGYLVNGQRYESEPDVFFFNFPGHSGKFMINEIGGTATAFDTSRPSGEYKIDLGNIADIHFFGSLIIITTGDGYKYYFGGFEAQGIYYIKNQIFQEDGNTSDSESQENTCDSWYLSKIIAPNGRQVVYSYDCDFNTLVDESCHPFASRESKGFEIIDNSNPAGSSSGASTRFLRGRILRTAPVPRLSSLTVLDKDGLKEICKVSFSYGTRKKEVYKRVNGVSNDLNNPGKLDQIIVTGINEEQLLRCDFTYRYTGTTSTPGNRVLLLNKMHIKGLGDYTMEYYNQDNEFPYHGCSSLDHWGYWNHFSASYDAQALLPACYVDEVTNVETITSTYREPDPTVAISGMLKKITYPTGGWTTYEYDANQFHKRITKDGTEISKGIPVIKTGTADCVAGGLRLRRITDHADASTAVTKEYLYIDGDGNSSGMLYHSPRYNHTYLISYNYPDINVHYLSQSKTDYPAYMLDRSFLGYSRVTERYADGSKKATQYYDYQDIQDISEYDSIVWNTAFSGYGNGVASASPNYIYQYLRDTQSLSRCRGKIKQTTTYDAAGQLVEKNVIQYSLTKAKAKKISCLRTDIDSIYVFHNYVGDYPVISETQTTYSSSGAQPVVTTYSYTYNSIGQLKKRTTSIPGTYTYNENYLYVKDLAGRTAAQDSMIVRNILNPYIYRTLAVTRSGTAGARLIEGEKHEYSLFTIAGQQLPALSQISYATVSSTTTYSSPSALTWKPQITVTELDNYGRPMEIKDANGIYTTYLWGYGGLYPLMRFENCSILQLGQRFHIGFHQFDGGWSGITEATATILRNIPGVNVTYWKYQPLVGVKEIIDPTGRKTTYTYNMYGRLVGITGPDDKKVVEYDYSTDSK